MKIQMLNTGEVQCREGKPIGMKKSTRIAGIIFLLLSLAEVISLAFHITGVNPILKPLLIPSLAVSALCALLPEHGGWKTSLLAVALALHTAGDILLLLDGSVFFVAGLGTFLLGHICYLVILFSGMGLFRDWKETILSLLPFALALMAVSLLDVKGALRVVITIYALALLFVPTAGGLWLLHGCKMGWRILTGGLLFVVSDTMLGLNVFNGIGFSLHHAIVMCTYLAAEWLLVSGMVHQRLHDTLSH
jgi:uncharacterized membrane protein YhhN